MKTIAAILIITLGSFFIEKDISMVGININDSKSALRKIHLKVIDKDETMTKYRTENGNDLSVTVENDSVVYMENDWLHQPKGIKPLFSDFKFGETTLKEIRKTLGTNGFTYVQRNNLVTETDIVEFNCFEFDSANKEVLVMITKAAIKPDVTENNIGDRLKLEAIVIANPQYLDRIWGDQKAFDPNYKKIKP